MAELEEHQKLKFSQAVPPRYINIYKLLREQTTLYGSRTALIFFDSQMTFEELYYSAISGSYYLKHNMGLKKGDHVSLLADNCKEFVLLYFACLVSGIIVVPINPKLSSREIDFIANNSDSKILFYKQELSSKVDTLSIKKISIDLNLFSASEHLFSVKNLDVLRTSLWDDAVIIYTSGTTGNPKGVILSQANLIYDAQAIAEKFQFNKETRTLCILPLFHNNGQVVTLLAPLSVGGSLVLVESVLVLKSFWEIVEKYQCTWLSVMPSILSVLLREKKSKRRGSLQGIICGGQTLSEEIQKKFEDAFRVPIFEGFGLTETTSFSCFNDYPAEKRRKRSVGRPLNINEMKVLDENGHVVLNEVGEICICGLNVTRGYYNLPDLNEKSFRNGWFHTGDYGYETEDGYFYFAGRHDFLIIKGGENIYPSETENVLLKHPEIADCAVIGIPDPILGQELCAFVKLTINSSLDKKTIIGFCADYLAYFKCPKEVIIINTLSDLSEIPKGPTQKILYRLLVDYFKSNFLESI